MASVGLKKNIWFVAKHEDIWQCRACFSQYLNSVVGFCIVPEWHDISSLPSGMISIVYHASVICYRAVDCKQTQAVTGSETECTVLVYNTIGGSSWLNTAISQRLSVDGDIPAWISVFYSFCFAKLPCRAREEFSQGPEMPDPVTPTTRTSYSPSQGPVTINWTLKVFCRNHPGLCAGYMVGFPMS